MLLGRGSCCLPYLFQVGLSVHVVFEGGSRSQVRFVKQAIDEQRRCLSIGLLHYCWRGFSAIMVPAGNSAEWSMEPCTPLPKDPNNMNERVDWRTVIFCRLQQVGQPWKGIPHIKQAIKRVR